MKALKEREKMLAHILAKKGNIEQERVRIKHFITSSKITAFIFFLVKSVLFFLTKSGIILKCFKYILLQRFPLCLIWSLEYCLACNISIA